MNDGLPDAATGTAFIPFKNDEYANLNARAASQEANALVTLLCAQVSRWELETEARKSSLGMI
jgi:hypothetical protein